MNQYLAVGLAVLGIGALAYVIYTKTADQLAPAPQQVIQYNNTYESYDGVVWGGPGWYYGLWFTDAALFYTWQRDYYYRRGWGGHHGGHHGGGHHGGGHHGGGHHGGGHHGGGHHGGGHHGGGHRH